jgi:hypothetical protein
MSEPITVSIPQAEGTQRVLIPMDIPQILFNSGAITLYAVKLCGWTPTVLDENNLQIDNPISAMQAAALRVRGIVKEEQKAIIASQAAEDARAATITAFDALFG